MVKCIHVHFVQVTLSSEPLHFYYLHVAFSNPPVVNAVIIQLPWLCRLLYIIR